MTGKEIKDKFCPLGIIPLSINLEEHKEYDVVFLAANLSIVEPDTLCIIYYCTYRILEAEFFNLKKEKYVYN